MNTSHFLSICCCSRSPLFQVLFLQIMYLVFRVQVCPGTPQTVTTNKEQKRDTKWSSWWREIFFKYEWEREQFWSKIFGFWCHQASERDLPENIPLAGAVPGGKVWRSHHSCCYSFPSRSFWIQRLSVPYAISCPPGSDLRAVTALYLCKYLQDRSWILFKSQLAKAVIDRARAVQQSDSF